MTIAEKAGRLRQDDHTLLKYICRDDGWRDPYYCGGLTTHFRGPAARLRNLGLIERKSGYAPMHRRTELGLAALRALADQPLPHTLEGEMK